MDGSDTSSTSTCLSLCTSWGPDEYDHHIFWDFSEAYLDEDMGRIALSCYLSLDLLVNGQVFVRTSPAFFSRDDLLNLRDTPVPRSV